MKRKSPYGDGYRRRQKPYLPSRATGRPRGAIILSRRNRPMAPPSNRGWRTPIRELKYYDTFTAPGDLTGAGAVMFCLNDMVMGSAANQRNGRKIHMSSIQYRVNMQSTAMSVAAALDGYRPITYGRMILYIDFQPNGAFPAISDLLQLTVAPGYDLCVASLQLAYRERYKILADKVFAFGQYERVIASGITSSAGPACHMLKKYIRVGCATDYNDTNGGTIADITTGALNVMFLGDGTAYGYRIRGCFRLRYEDG